jgi:hypothetical protein
LLLPIPPETRHLLKRLHPGEKVEVLYRLGVPIDVRVARPMVWSLDPDGQDWMQKSAVYAMLAHAMRVGRATTRKLRLFGVACCRRIWHLLPDELHRKAVELAEEFADDTSKEDQLRRAYEASRATLDSRKTRKALGGVHAARAANYTACLPDKFEVVDAIWFASADACNAQQAVTGASSNADGGGRTEQTDLLRDIVGNPFCSPPCIDPSWLTWNDGVVRRLAEAAYQEREMPSGHLDQARLGVLADALEEAGCAEPMLLSHCREQAAVHVRGCFVLDLLLGKE